jgi:integrative and conjugative element protein (TIGR02256 family)
VPVATTAFEAEYGGELVQIAVGEIVSPGHELFRRFPDMFGRDGKKVAPKPRRRSATATRPRSAVTRSAIRIELTPAARRTIMHGAQWQSGIDGLETGGWLIGGGLERSVAVTHATLPGARATRGRDFLYHSLEGLEQFELRRMWGDPLAARVGCWHTHPEGTGEPSDTDLKAWRAGLDGVNRQSWQPYYPAIIAAPNKRHGWDLHAWVATKRNGKTVVEPATIRDIQYARSAA